MELENTKNTVINNINIPRFKKIYLILPLLLIILSILIIGSYFLKIGFSQPVIKEDKKDQLVFAPVIKLNKPFDSSFKPVPFFCPAIPLCKNEKSYQNKTLLGNIPKQTSLFAAFDGNLESLTTTHPLDNNEKEEFTTLTLKNLDQGLIAYYYFKGEPIVKTEVKEGEEIAIVTGEKLEAYENNSFAFQVIKFNEDGSQTLLDIKPINFK